MKDAAKAATEAMTANDLLVHSIVDLNDALAATGGLGAAAAHEIDAIRNAAAAADPVVGSLRDRIALTSSAAGGLSRSFGGLAAKTAGVLTPALALLDDELDKKILALGGVAAAAAALSGAMTATAAKTTAAGAGMRIWGTGIRLTGTALHWIVAGTMEFLAVAIPATVAAGAWAAAWMQGAGNVAEHMTAVYDASEATANIFHTTAGQVVGLGDALQRAQNQANPQVYQALGGAINLVKEGAGGLAQEGVQVGRIFDQFMGKLVYDFSKAGGGASELHGLLSDMIPDLVKFGQIFGNLGHFIASFASQMPGLAEVLLSVLDAFTELLKGIVDFTGWLGHLGLPILTIVMGLEEFARWGGLLSGVLTRLGLSTVALGGNFSSLSGFLLRIGTVAQSLLTVAFSMVTTVIINFGRALSLLPGFLGTAGAAMVGFGDDCDALIASMTPLMAATILGAVVVLGILIDKMLTAQTAAQKLTAAMQQQITTVAGSQVFAVAAGNMSKLTEKIQAQQGAIEAWNKQSVLGGIGTALKEFFTLGNEWTIGQNAEQNVNTFTAEIERQGHAVIAATGNAQALASKLGISLPAAYQLATEAGVSLTGKILNQKGQWTALGEQIRNAAAGFRAMGGGTGALGGDMTSLAIASALAASKLSSVQQATSAYMQDITGGTGALSSFETSLSNIGDKIATNSQNLGEYSGHLSDTMKQFADQLTTYTGKGAAAWQNFDQIMGSTVPQMVNWLQMAGTMGVLKMGQFHQAILDMIGQLAPLASKSKVAQSNLMAFAEQNGVTASSFKGLVGQVRDSGASTANFSKIISQATIAMGNMDQVAQNLGTVMSGQVTAAISAAALKASGFTTDVNNLAEAMQSGQAAGHTAAYWAHAAATAYNDATTNAANAANAIQRVNTAMADARSKTVDFQVNLTGGGAVYFGAGGSGTATGGGGHITNGAGPGAMVIHVHGSTMSSAQEIARKVQTAVNQKTIRNGSTQLYIGGRRH